MLNDENIMFFEDKHMLSKGKGLLHSQKNHIAFAVRSLQLNIRNLTTPYFFSILSSYFHCHHS